jgi:trehalose 2-sulfotransferase
MSHRLAYLICATPRSGTTMLCDLLSASCQAGRPQSYYRRQDIDARAAGWGLWPADFPDQLTFEQAYLDAVLEEGSGDTEVFGLRLMWGTVGEVVERLGPLHGAASAKVLFETIYGPLVYVHVTRRDKVAQAISLMKAEQSGLWHVAADGSDRQRSAPTAPVRYDAGRIGELAGELESEDAAWTDYFVSHGIAPVRVEYEALAADPHAGVGKVLIALGCPPDAIEGLAAQTSRMADAQSNAWAERFRGEHG